jgi:hypothetical protein
MHLPKTNEGWSALAAVVSAFAALLNLVLIGFLARYTIRQTGLLKMQSDASATQTELLKKETMQRAFREIHFALAGMSQMMRDSLAIKESIHSDSLDTLTIQSVRPADWPASAAALISVFPAMIPLPSQLDVEMVAIDTALAAYRRAFSSSEKRKAIDQISKAIGAAIITIPQITRFLTPGDSQ